jgi:hypothetical protein
MVKTWSKMVNNGKKWSTIADKNTKIPPLNVKHIYILQYVPKQLQNIFYRSSLVQLIARNS